MNRFLLPICLSLLIFSFDLAAVESFKALPSSIIATVNGVEISDIAFNQLLKANTGTNRIDSYDLRVSLKQELINRKLLAQEAVKQDLLQQSIAVSGLYIDLITLPSAEINRVLANLVVKPVELFEARVLINQGETSKLSQR